MHFFLCVKIEAEGTENVLSPLSVRVYICLRACWKPGMININRSKCISVAKFNNETHLLPGVVCWPMGIFDAVQLIKKKCFLKACLMSLNCIRA